MRPYLAVIKDAFREAMASRVLWVLLAIITLFLAVITPFGLQEKAPSTLRADEITDSPGFLAALSSAGNSPEPSPGRHLWGLLPPDLKLRAKQAEHGPRAEPVGRSGRYGSIHRQLNDLFKDPKFYDEAAWRNVHLGNEARTLLGRPSGELTSDELSRRNRLLLEAAFPDFIEPAAGKAVYASYFGHEFGAPLPLEFRHVRQILEQALLGIVRVLLGMLGTFVAILVTAPTIPHTFEPGAVDLLLSKPISRSLLFLAKFLGGCAFILLNAAYLISGLWLIAGLRHGIWSNELLLCLPIFLFLFAIYYSVSAFAGVVWRGAIISVVMTIVFWLACTVVGAAKTSVENLFLNATRLATLVPAGETLIAANKGGESFEWDDKRRVWEPIFDGAGQPSLRFAFRFPMIGPVYDVAGDRILAIDAVSSRMAFAGGAETLIVGRRADDWKRTLGVGVPSRTVLLSVATDGQILAVAPTGIYVFKGDPSVERKPFKLFGIDVSPYVKGAGSGEFVRVVENPFPRMGNPLAAAVNPDGDEVVIFSRGKLRLFTRDGEKRFHVSQETDLNTDEPAVLAVAGNTAAVALGDGSVRLFDVGTLTLRREFVPFGSHAPRTAAASPDGRWFGVLYHHRQLWLYDAAKQRQVRSGIRGQGEISGVAFAPNGRLLVADRFTRVTEYSVDPLSVESRHEPNSTWLEWAYWYAISPIYTVFPKPGELNNLVNYLITNQQTSVLRGELNNLQGERLVFDVWQPVWSNLAFLATMLGLTCIYVSRNDF